MQIHDLSIKEGEKIHVPVPPKRQQAHRVSLSSSTGLHALPPPPPPGAVVFASVPTVGTGSAKSGASSAEISSPSSASSTSTQLPTSTHSDNANNNEAPPTLHESTLSGEDWSRFLSTPCNTTEQFAPSAVEDWGDFEIAELALAKALQEQDD